MRKVALMTKKILVTEDLVQEGIDSLTEHGYEVDTLIDPTAEELASAIAPYDALIVHPNTVVDSALLDAAENLKIIGRAGVTVDNIDIEAASERGVIVCNAPNSNVISAAEQTMALLLAAARHIPEASASMHEGQWRRADFMGSELFGKTLAIFGLGRVGGLVAGAGRGLRHEPHRARPLLLARARPASGRHALRRHGAGARPGRLHHGAPAPHGEHARHVRRRRVRRHEGRGRARERGPWRHLQHGRPGRFRGRRQDRGRWLWTPSRPSPAPTRPCTSSKTPF